MKLSENKIKIISKNISAALAYADQAVKEGKKIEGPTTDRGFDAFYHAEMDRLCKKDGVRV